MSVPKPAGTVPPPSCQVFVVQAWGSCFIFTLFFFELETLLCAEDLCLSHAPMVIPCQCGYHTGRGWQEVCAEIVSELKLLQNCAWLFCMLSASVSSSTAPLRCGHCISAPSQSSVLCMVGQQFEPEPFKGLKTASKHLCSPGSRDDEKHSHATSGGDGMTCAPKPVLAAPSVCLEL